MKYLIVFLMSASLLAGCSECKKDNTGEVCFENSTTSNITVTVEGFEPFTVYATTTKCWSFPDGSYSYSAVTFGTSWSGTIRPEECGSDGVEFIK